MMYDSHADLSDRRGALGDRADRFAVGRPASDSENIETLWSGRERVRVCGASEPVRGFWAERQDLTDVRAARAEFDRYYPWLSF